VRRRSAIDRFGPLGILVSVALVLSMPFSIVANAVTVTFPVQSEQVITGTTTGLAGAQTDDGVLESLFESDTAPDFLTVPATQTLTTGTMVAGTFPGDVSSEDGMFAQYREAAAVGEEADIAYRSNTGASTVNGPKTRAWDGSTWTGETEQPTAGSPLRAVRMAWSSTSSTARIVVTESNDGWLDAYVCTPACTVTNNVGQVWSTAPITSEIRFDIAYEPLSGEALLVYHKEGGTGSQDIAYRTHNGGGWSAEQYLDDAGHVAHVVYSLIKLAAKNGTDQIGMIGGDDTNNHVNAWIWDGSAWGSSTEITAAANPPNHEEVAIAWETNSGHLLAVAAETAQIRSKEYTTSWSSSVAYAFGGINPMERLSLKPNPAGNDMVIAASTDGDDMGTAYWTGAAWANGISHETEPDNGGRSFDFAWEPTGSKGLLVWGSNSYAAGQIRRKTFTAPSTWSGPTIVTMGANSHPWVQLRTNPSPGVGATKILGAVMEATALDLGGITWDGATFTVIGASTFSPDVGTALWESFELEYHSTTDDMLLVRYNWSGVPAGDSYVLSVKGYRGDEDFHVQVLTPPATWTTRITVNSVTNQLFSVGLTGAEYNGGDPQVRFVDGGPQGTVSDLFLDWVAIATTRATYSLEVRQNVTGVPAEPNPILSVKGNITAGGENFHVQAWNFVSVSWDLLLAAPFTATNAYHNASLPPSYLSGGTVRVRFVDAATVNTTRWALSLDFVAVAITNNRPTLTDGGASPVSGDIATSFAFFVRYSDPENNAPAFVNLTLDGTPYAMVENSSSDTNYVDGKDYSLVRGIGVRGTFDFSFSAQAASGDFSLVTSPAQQVSVLNRAPSISNGIASDAVHTSRSYVRDFDGSDPDGDPPAWSLSTDASWLSVGPANGTVWGVAPSTVGGFFVNITLSDGFGGSASSNYTLSVGNLAPSISNPTVSDSVHAGRSYLRDFDGTDPEGDALAWSMSTNASWLAIGPANGTVWGVAPATVNMSYVNITLSDGFGGSTWNNYTLSVGNTAPAISNPIGSTSAFRRASVAVDFDASDPESDALVWSLWTNAGFLTVGAANGTVFGLALNVPAAYWVEVLVSDGFGGMDRVNFTLSVVNRPPQASVTAPGTAIENDTYQGTFSGSDPDGDALSWTLASNATWLAIDPVARTLSGTASPGVYFVNLTATDGYGGLAYQNITVTVARSLPQPPPLEPPFDPFIILTLEVLAFAILIFLVGAPRRRSILEQAFLLDAYGTVRFRYDGPGAPFNEAQVVSLLDATDWRERNAVPAEPHTLHLIHRNWADWVLVSRSKETAKVAKEAERVIAGAEKDWRPLVSAASGS
jgi:hypothetical protein